MDLPCYLNEDLGKQCRLYTSSFHGARISRRSHLLASALSNSSLTGSHFSFLPERRAMLPRWHTVTERWPTSGVQMHSLGSPLRTASRKLPMWSFLVSCK